MNLNTEQEKLIVEMRLRLRLIQKHIDYFKKLEEEEKIKIKKIELDDLKINRAVQ